MAGREVCDKGKQAVRTAAAAQRESPKTAFFGLDPRVPARMAGREVCDKGKQAVRTAAAAWSGVQAFVTALFLLAKQ